MSTSLTSEFFLLTYIMTLVPFWQLPLDRRIATLAAILSRSALHYWLIINNFVSFHFICSWKSIWLDLMTDYYWNPSCGSATQTTSDHISCDLHISCTEYLSHLSVCAVDEAFDAHVQDIMGMRNSSSATQLITRKRTQVNTLAAH